MEWFRKFFGRDDYSADQTRFAALHHAAKGPRGMIMLAGSNKLFQDMVYLRLPEPMAKVFEGYEKCEPPSESQVIGLYGDQRDLNEHIKMRR
jgi:hypothetical protein